MNITKKKNPSSDELFFLVHAVDVHSNKSALIPPLLPELERLVQMASRLQASSVPAKHSSETMRNLRRRLAPQTIQELVARYNTGETSVALSAEFGISKCGLLQLLRSEGVTLRKQPITPEDTERAVRLYESGLTIDEIVRRIGYSYGAIRKSLHASGVVLRPKGVKRTSL